MDESFKDGIDKIYAAVEASCYAVGDVISALDLDDRVEARTTAETVLADPWEWPLSEDDKKLIRRHVAYQQPVRFMVNGHPQLATSVILWSSGIIAGLRILLGDVIHQIDELDAETISLGDMDGLSRVELDAFTQNVTAYITNEYLAVARGVEQDEQSWSGFHAPSDWQQAWSCGETKWRELRDSMQCDHHPVSNHRSVRFLRAELDNLGLSEPD